MVSVEFTAAEPLGLTFREDVENNHGGLIEVVRIKHGSAAAALGVRIGWLVAAVNEQPMRGLEFDDVMEVLRSKARPMRVQFEARSMGGGWLYDVPITTPTGRELTVSICAGREEVRTIGELKAVLAAEHCPGLRVPAQALRIIESKGSGGETKRMELAEGMLIKDVVARLGQGALLSLSVDAPHRAPPALAKHSLHLPAEAASASRWPKPDATLCAGWVDAEAGPASICDVLCGGAAAAVVVAEEKAELSPQIELDFGSFEEPSSLSLEAKAETPSGDMKATEGGASSSLKCVDGASPALSPLLAILARELAL